MNCVFEKGLTAITYTIDVLFVVPPSSLLDDQNIRTLFMVSLLKTIYHGEQGKAQKYPLSHLQDQIQPFSLFFQYQLDFVLFRKWNIDSIIIINEQWKPNEER